MSEHRLRQGHNEPRNLWQHHVNEEPASKSGECVGRIDSAELAAEICTAVNAARDAEGDLYDRVRYAVPHDELTAEQADAVMGVVAPHLADAAELERLRKLERYLESAVWVDPGRMGGAACVGGHRVTVDSVAGLVPDVGTERISEDYPGVTPEGARAAVYFAGRYVDRHSIDSDLEAATQFEFPNGVTVSRQWDGAWRVSWPNPEAPGPAHRYHPMTEDYPDREAALARARQLAEEAPVDDG